MPYRALGYSPLGPLTVSTSITKISSNGTGSVSVAGGWGQLGGHAALSAQYGFGVDQWLEAKVVTADGQYLIANRVSNPDLFWALRGGGGGTFGVVVEATIRAHIDRPITVLAWWMNGTSMLG